MTKDIHELGNQKNGAAPCIPVGYVGDSNDLLWLKSYMRRAERKCAVVGGGRATKTVLYVGGMVGYVTVYWGAKPKAKLTGHSNSQAVYKEENDNSDTR